MLLKVYSLSHAEHTGLEYAWDVRARRTFHSMDTNGDGRIDRAEFHAALVAEGVLLVSESAAGERKDASIFGSLF